MIFVRESWAGIEPAHGGGDDSDGCPSYPGDSDSPGEGDGSSGEGSGD